MENNRIGNSIEVIVLAAGKDFNGLELFGSNALVPVVNRPLISFSLEILKQQNFSNIHIVCYKSASKLFHQYLSREFPTVTLHSVSGDVANTGDRGSLDILRETAIKVKPSSEVIIFPCDLLAQSSFLIKKVLEEHWRRNAALTVVLSKYGEKLASTFPGSSKNSLTFDTAIVDNRSNRLLYLRNHGSIAKDVNFPQEVLSKFPSMSVLTDITNTHFLIMRGMVFNFILGQQKWSNLYDDAVSSLICDQRDLQTNFKQANAEPEEDAKTPGRKTQRRENSEFADLMVPVGLAKLRQDFESRGVDHVGDASFCCAFVVHPQDLCWRTNNFASYVEATARLLSSGSRGGRRHPSVVLPPKTSVGGESFVGSETAVGEGSKVKSSVIGSKCVLHEGVRMTASVLMDGAAVGKGSVISNCLIGPGASIGTNAELKDCVVASNAEIPNEAKASGLNLPDDLMNAGF